MKIRWVISGAVLIGGGVFAVLANGVDFSTARPLSVTLGPDAAMPEPAASPGAKSRARAAPVYKGPLAAPTFDIVRIEPDGMAVVTGQGVPGSTVTVLLDSKPIGMARVSARGEWSLVVPNAVAPGSHNLTLVAASPDGRETIRSRAVVSIGLPAGGDEDPMVVVNQRKQPGQGRSTAPDAKTGPPETEN